MIFSEKNKRPSMEQIETHDEQSGLDLD